MHFNKFTLLQVTKKCSIPNFIFVALLIMLVSSVSYAQTTPGDSIIIRDDSFEDIILYGARDSIYSDIKKRQIHLFGDAHVESEGISMRAGYIMIDLNNNEIYARYAYDKDSNRVEYPVFSEGSEKITATSIRYNFNTDKGYIEELKIQQDEIFLYMGVAKRHPNEQIHFKEGKFTTCNLEEPHYHFQLSRAVMIPEKRIVTGPMNLWIKGVPTFLGLPYSVIPQQKERTHGLLFPEIVPLSVYGFGVQNLGYYYPINDRLQTTAYVNLYSRGSWGLRNVLDYAKRYGFRGSLDLGFQQFKSGFPANQNNNKLSIAWIHSKELKSNPYWNFSSNVNFISDNQSKNNLDPLNPQYFNNSFNSDINLQRLFPGKPLSMGMKISVRQNSLSKTVALIAPVYNLNMTRVFPFRDVVKSNNGLAQMAKRLGVTYNLEGQNKSTFADSLLTDGDLARISEQFLNGFNQNIGIQTTGAFFKNTLKFTPSLTYGNKINFQQIRKSYDPIINNSSNDTLFVAGMSHDLSMQGSFTTMLYSYYRYAGKKQALMRHIMTPTIGVRYVPQLNTLITDSVGIDKQLVTYSPFERSVYSAGTAKTSGQLTFGVNNTFELKRKSDKDTITGFKKTRIIDMLSATGYYDFMRDSMKLSDINLNMRVNPIEWLNFVANSVFSPYNWVDSTGATTSDFAVTTRSTLGRFLRNDFATTITITSKASREILNSNQENVLNNWNADYNYYLLHPEYVLNYAIPWKLSFSHVYSINYNTNISALSPEKLIRVQTLVINGDLSFTKRWKLASTLNLDLQDFLLTNVRFNLSRNMHCWALNFYWTPIGTNKSFLFSLRNTSSLFQSAKIDLRKPPVFL